MSPWIRRPQPLSLLQIWITRPCWRLSRRRGRRLILVRRMGKSRVLRFCPRTRLLRRGRTVLHDGRGCWDAMVDKGPEGFELLVPKWRPGLDRQSRNGIERWAYTYYSVLFWVMSASGLSDCGMQGKRYRTRALIGCWHLLVEYWLVEFWTNA